MKMICIISTETILYKNTYIPIYILTYLHPSVFFDRHTDIVSSVTKMSAPEKNVLKINQIQNCLFVVFGSCLSDKLPTNYGSPAPAAAPLPSYGDDQATYGAGA
jgi:hypothetical protein